MRYYLACYCCCVAISVSAQRADSLFAEQAETGWVLAHKVKPGETLFALARRFHVPPSILAETNDMNYQTSLKIGQTVIVPVAAYNQLTERPEGNDFRALWYRVQDEQELRKIARRTGVSQKTVQQWNKLHDVVLTPRKALLIGWVRYDATETAPAKGELSVPIKEHFPDRKPTKADQEAAEKLVSQRRPDRDTIYLTGRTEHILEKPVNIKKQAIADTGKPTVATTNSQTTEARIEDTDAARMYQQQQDSRSKKVNEKGSAAFYPAGQLAGHTLFYALHNSAPKGTVIMVHNPGTDKHVFVKVLGKMPNTRLYHNCIIGISEKARQELGADTEKVWCELSYAY